MNFLTKIFRYPARPSTIWKTSTFCLRKLTFNNLNVFITIQEGEEESFCSQEWNGLECLELHIFQPSTFRRESDKCKQQGWRYLGSSLCLSPQILLSFHLYCSPANCITKYQWEACSPLASPDMWYHWNISLFVCPPFLLIEDALWNFIEKGMINLRIITFR